MNKKWILECILVIGAVLAFGLFFFLPGKQTRADQLVVGTNAEFPPFTFIENGKVVGFDIDIATKVCQRLGKKIEFKDMPFDALIPALTLGQVNFVAAGMSYTTERAKRVLFTKSYINDAPLVILTIAKVNGLEDLLGKTVVVNDGFTADLYMSTKTGYTLIRLPTVSDAFLALKSGRVDAFITAKNTVDAFLASHKGVQFHVCVIPGTAETCALVISKKYPELLPEIQKALDEMTQDGTLEKLKTKWGLS